MTKLVDARGLACPAPVLAAKDAIEAEPLGALDVLVDNEASAENVTRFLEGMGYFTAMERQGADLCVKASRSGEPQVSPGKDATGAAEGGKILVLITSDRIGHGDDTLGARLMVNFVNTLKEMGDLWRIILLNSGVKLAVSGSPVLEALAGLNHGGVSILVCGTCLDFYGILDEKQVGQTTNMLDVVTSLAAAHRVVSP